MPRPRLQADSDLLSQSMQLFWRKGYANTALRDLEEALGLKAPALYHRFGNKNGLFRATLEHYLERIVGRRISRYLEDPDPLHGLRRFFETTYDYIDADHPPLACLMVNTAAEFGDRDPDVHAILQRSRDRLRAALLANLTRLRDSGRLHPEANLDDLADTLYLCLQGLLVGSKADPDMARLDRQVDLILALLPLVPATPE